MPDYMDDRCRIEHNCYEDEDGHWICDGYNVYHEESFLGHRKTIEAAQRLYNRTII